MVVVVVVVEVVVVTYSLTHSLMGTGWKLGLVCANGGGVSRRFVCLTLLVVNFSALECTS